jgi:acetylornithine deacetylase
MRRIGLDVEIQDAAPGRPNVIGVLAAPGRPNVIGVLEASARGRTLMLCGHLDTVGVQGMSAPFDPVERDGRLYGRGAQDMKGGVAAMIDAARAAAERGFRKGRLVVAAVADEEFASVGADALVTKWTADGAVVTEPTDLQIGVAHKGFAWLEVDVRGRAAHGSRPREGRDAILRMGRVLQRLERLDRELQARPPHRFMGTGSLHASTVCGGREWSSYPDQCRVQLERRTVVSETAATAADEIEQVLAALRHEDAEFEADAKLVFARPPYEIDPGHDLVTALGSATSQLAPIVGMSFWTDAAILAQAGIPSILFGPGGAGLHSVEEYVLVEEVARCRDALTALALAWP